MNDFHKKQFRVLLIGDSCEDEYIYGKCERISPEAPIPILEYSKNETRVGMAGNVYLNLQAFEIDVTFLTNIERIIKTRFIDETKNIQVLRVDNEEKIKPLMLPVVTDNFDAIIISDYDKGYITESKLFDIVENSNIPTFLYSKKTHLPNKENCFVVMNELEYEKIYNTSYIDNLIITKSSGGCIYRNVLYQTEKVKVSNAIGVCDVFLSALVYGYLIHKDIVRGIFMANGASSISAQKLRTYVLTQEDIATLTKC